MTTENNNSSKCEQAEPFALQVLGDSMQPEFMDKQIIIIDPTGVARHKSYVLAFYDDEYIFRQLLIKDKKYFLSALNPNYHIKEIKSLDSIKGIITQKAGARRKEHKRYD
ncbi:MAG: S24 family peptidase [Gammaproteobacteria bacterium]|nr:MAG: S24 family peptidase [Gammaproteobacteria bacterium]